MPEKRAARNWPRWLVYFTAFVMVAAVALTIIPYLYLPVAAGGPAQRDFSDYAIMLQYYPSGARLGMPTLQEFKRLLKLWPTVPPAQNAALYYLKGTSLLRRRGAPDGSATTYFDHPYAGDLAALEKWIADNKEALDQVLAGNRLKVCTFPPFGASRPGSLGSIEYLAYMRQAARVMADADFIEEMKGNSGAAAEWLLDCIRFGKHMQHGPIIAGLVGIGASSTGSDALDRLIANAPLSEPTLRKVIQVCPASEPDGAEFLNALDSESELMRPVPSLSPITNLKNLLLIIERRALARSRRYYFEKPLPELLKIPEAQAMLADSAKDPGLLFRVRLEYAKDQTHLRGTVIRAALSLYREQHEKFPDRLEALVPDILPSMPEDPFICQAFHYERTSNGWRLWSVGPDMKDEHGASGYSPSGSIVGDDILFESRLPSELDLRTGKQPPQAAAPETHGGAKASGGAPRAAGAAADPLGLSPLHYAANRGDLDAVRSLLEDGADVNARANVKQAPLHLAATKAVAELLISKGADIEARDAWGRTPLFWAAGAGRKGVVEALLTRGAKPDAAEKPPQRDTLGDAVVAQLGKRLKMNIPSPDTSAKTPITRAEEQGYDDVAQILRESLKRAGRTP